MEEEKKQAMIRVDEDVDKLVGEYARRTGLAKGEVLRRLLAETMTEKKLNLEDYAKVTELITKTPPSTQRTESFSASMQDLALATLQQKMVERLMSGEDSGSKTLEKLMMLRLMTQPDPITVQLMQRNLSPSPGSSGMEDFMKTYLQQQQQIQNQMLQQLFGKKLEETEARATAAEKELLKREEQEAMEKRIEEEVARRLQPILEQAQAKPPITSEERKSFEAEVAEVVGDEVRKVAIEAVKERLTESFESKEPITTPTGQVDWGKVAVKLVNRALAVGERIAEKLPPPGYRPPQVPVKEMPIPPQPTPELETPPPEATPLGETEMDVWAPQPALSPATETPAEAASEMEKPVEGTPNEHPQKDLSKAPSSHRKSKTEGAD